MSDPAKRQGRVQRAVVVAAVAVLALFFVPKVLLTAFSMAFVWESPIPEARLSDLHYVRADGAFYVAVVSHGSSDLRWLRSTDGGAHWAGTSSAPLSRETPDPNRGPDLDCADDGVCYRADEGELIDQAITITRADRGNEPRAEGSVAYCKSGHVHVNAADSSQAMIFCNDDMVGYRTPGGEWVMFDLLAVATAHR